MKVEFCYGVFFSQFIAKANFTITPSGVHRLPTLSRTFSSADALSRAWARHAAPSTRGPNITSSASVCAQEPSSTFMLPILNARVRASLPQVRLASELEPSVWPCGRARRSVVVARHRAAFDDPSAPDHHPGLFGPLHSARAARAAVLLFV